MNPCCLALSSDVSEATLTSEDFWQCLRFFTTTVCTEWIKLLKQIFGHILGSEAGWPDGFDKKIGQNSAQPYLTKLHKLNFSNVGLLLLFSKKLSVVNSKIRPIWSSWTEEKMLSACLIRKKGEHQKLFQRILFLIFYLNLFCSRKSMYDYVRSDKHFGDNRFFCLCFFFLCKV
jgi:hypothetical protein